MTNIGELLNLFEDDEVKKIILSSYTISQVQNKKLSDDVFERLYILKRTNPNLNIKVDYKEKKSSCYDPMSNTIFLNGVFEECIFFHELTHLFSYHYSNFSIPDEYNEFKSLFLQDEQNSSLIIAFLKLCEKEREKNLKEREKMLKEVQKNILILNTTITENIVKNTKNVLDYSIIVYINDIIDAIYSGKSSDEGLRYVKDNNTYVEKSSKSAGHGCEYYQNSGYEFEEIIADYQAIKLIDPNNELFAMLKQILGDKFVSFLEKKCQQMNNSKLLDEIDLNHNSIIYYN